MEVTMLWWDTLDDLWFAFRHQLLDGQFFTGREAKAALLLTVLILFIG
ncbi:MAG: hypothetical protein AB8F65_04835 [Woeseiaceae bacterium]